MQLRLEPRLSSPRWLVVGVPVLSVVFALLVGAIFLLATGHNPLSAYGRILDDGFTSYYGITDTLGLATPLICTGLAAAFAFRMNLFNIGEEGQLYLGMIAAAWMGIVVVDGWPVPLAVAGVLVAGAIGGAAWVLVPAVLRARLGTSEIVSSLLLNYVALNLVNYFIYGSRTVLRADSPFPEGREIAASAQLDGFGNTNTYPTLVIAVVLAVALSWFIRRSNFGYETSVMADSPSAARYAGIGSGRLTVLVLVGSGALAGLGGGMYVVGPLGKIDPGLVQIGLGYAGIVVAALARYNFVAVVLTAVLFAGLRTGGTALQVSSDPVPIAISVVIQGAVLLFALGGELFRRNRVVLRRTVAVVA